MSDSFNNPYTKEVLNRGGYGNDPYGKNNSYNSNNPYADNNPHKNDDPYANNYNPHQQNTMDTQEQAQNKYPFCNTYFLLQDKFRAFFNADVDLHEEKRDYIGDPEKVLLQTLMWKNIGKAFFSTFFLVTISYFLFLLGNIYMQIISVVLLFAIYALWLYCPAYITYSTKQYVIGDRTFELYKHWVSGFKIKVNVLIVGGLTNLASIIFLSTYKDYIISSIKNPKLHHFIAYIFHNLTYNSIIFSTIYILLIGAYFIFANRVKAMAEKLKIKNYKDAKWVKTKNTFQQKQAKLSGEWE